MANPRVMFVYWGRRGALSQFTLQAAEAALADDRLTATISVSRQNELFASFEQLGPSLWPIDTFTRDSSAVLQAWRIPLLRRQFYEKLKNDRIELVVELMPHIWSFLLMPMANKAGARYCTIVHDADAHPGDRTSMVKVVLDRVLAQADVVFTLSGAVAGRLSSLGLAPMNKIFPLQHPDLMYAPWSRRAPRNRTAPLRLLFLGRIMAYKGLTVFVDAAEVLRDAGLPIKVGVFGEGTIGEAAKRLQTLDAEVVNRWLTSDEISNVLSRYDLVVLSHVEASQSGVAAAAFGAGVPVVATPVGGLVEQVVDGVTGVLARRADGDALAEAIKRLAVQPEAYDMLCRNLEHTRSERSMARFVEEIVTQGLFVKPAGGRPPAMANELRQPITAQQSGTQSSGPQH